MFFSKFTSATLFFLLALTATGRPSSKVHNVTKRSESSWDSLDDIDYDWDYNHDGGYWDDDHYDENSYWEHDYDQDHWDDENYDDHDEHEDEDEDDGDPDNLYLNLWDKGHYNRYGNRGWDHDWENDWNRDWDRLWDHDHDHYWDHDHDHDYDHDWENDWSYDYDNNNYGAMNLNAGAGTVYSQDGLAGSCGEYYDDSAFIAALGNSWMNWEFISPECGRQIRVTNKGTFYPIGGVGNSIIVTVMDTCESCDEDHIDLSIGAWNALTDGSDFGLLNVDWSFI